MDRKIGDYIHLHLDNYRKYGTNLQLRKKNKKGEWKKAPNRIATQFDFESYYNNYMSQNEKIKKYNKNNELQKLEDDLNMLMGRTVLNKDGKEKKLPDRYVKDVWKYVADELDDSEVFKYGINVDKSGIIRGDITQTKKEDIQKAITESIDKIRINKSGGIRLRTIISKIRELEKVADTLYGENTQNKLKIAIDSLYKGLENISKITESQLKENGFDKLTQLITGKQAEDLVGQVNNLITLYATIPNLNMKKGDLFEFLIAYCRGVAKEDLQDTINNAFKGEKVGDKPLSVLINPNLFSNKIDFSSLARSESLGEDTYIKIGTSKQKVDVIITKQNDSEFEPMNISAKNVSLSRSIKIVDESPLITFLQVENTSFVNHYLNVTAMHDKPYNEEKGKDNQDEIAAAHKAMKLVILYRALTGDLFQRNEKANIFVYNDSRAKGKVTVVDIPSLITRAMQEGGNKKDNFEKFISVKSNKKDLSSVRFANERAKSGYQERITNLILDLHKQKITATLKPSLLTSIAKGS